MKEKYMQQRILENIEREYKTLEYEEPKITKMEKMTFPIDILNDLGRGTVCKQCSSCHNCR